MQINAHFTDDDYVAFRLFYNQYDARNRRLILFNRSRALLVSAIFVLLFVYLGYEKSFILIESAILGLLSLLWFLFYPSYFIFMVRRSIKKMKKKGLRAYPTSQRRPRVWRRAGLTSIGT